MDTRQLTESLERILQIIMEVNTTEINSKENVTIMEIAAIEQRISGRNKQMKEIRLRVVLSLQMKIWS